MRTSAVVRAVCKRSLVAFALILSAGTNALAQSLEFEHARQLFEARRYEEALPLFRAMSAHGDIASTYWQGRTHYAMGATKDAIDCFERAVRANDTSSEFHLWLARGYAEAAQHTNILHQASLARHARQQWERAVVLDAKNIDARSDLVSFHLLAPGIIGGSHDKARQQALEIRKLDEYRGLTELARVNLADHDSTGAENQYRALVQSYPDSVAPFTHLVSQLQAQQKWNAAFALCNEVLSHSPNQSAAIYHLGKTAALSGQQLDVGEKSLRRYLTLSVEKGTPSYANARYRLGMIAERRGAIETARAEYQAALVLDPKLEDARRSLSHLKP